MNNVVFLSYGFSELGLRSENQDSIFMKKILDNLFVAAIADGVGGQPGGETASKEAVNAMKKFIKNNYIDIDIKKMFSYIHDHLKSISYNDNSLKRMATTFSACVFFDDVALIGHVGDTKIYQISNNNLTQRTHDQTEVQKLIDLQILTESRARYYRRKNVLLSAISPDKKYELYENKFEFKPADRFVLLTDGVYSVVSKDEILELSNNTVSIKTFTQKLKNLCTVRQPKDNYSAICIEVKVAE